MAKKEDELYPLKAENSVQTSEMMNFDEYELFPKAPVTETKEKHETVILRRTNEQLININDFEFVTTESSIIEDDTPKSNENEVVSDQVVKRVYIKRRERSKVNPQNKKELIGKEMESYVGTEMKSNKRTERICNKIELQIVSVNGEIKKLERRAETPLINRRPLSKESYTKELSIIILEIIEIKDRINLWIDFGNSENLKTNSDKRESRFKNNLETTKENESKKENTKKVHFKQSKNEEITKVEIKNERNDKEIENKRRNYNKIKRDEKKPSSNIEEVNEIFINNNNGVVKVPILRKNSSMELAKELKRVIQDNKKTSEHKIGELKKLVEKYSIS